MTQIGGIFTMQERLRACLTVALLALFLLAACGGQEIMDESQSDTDTDIVAMQPEVEASLDTDTAASDTPSEKIVIEQPLPEDFDIIDDGYSDNDILVIQDTENESALITDSVWSSADIVSGIGRNVKPPQKDWFLETGRSITPQGAFTLVTTIVTDDFASDIEERSVDCLIDITSVGSEREGYRTVIATLMLDCPDGLVWEMIPFDRYTGKAMVLHRLGNGSDDTAGYVNVGGADYEVGYTVEIGRGSDERASCEYKVTIPEDYDGLMFYVGYANANIAAEDDALLGESVELDLMPSWGSVSEYFFTE